MTLVAVKPGGWDEEEILTSDDLNALQAELIKGIDGTNGGEYAPANDLQFTGVVFRWVSGSLELVSTNLNINEDSTLELDGTLDVDGDYSLDGDGTQSGRLDVTATGETHINSSGLLRIDSGGFLTAAAGSITTLGGTVTFSSTAGVTFSSGSNVDLASIFNVLSAARIDVEDGGLIALVARASGGNAMTVGNNARINVAAGGAIWFAEADDLFINNAPFDFRIHLTPTSMSNHGSPDWDSYNGLPIWVQKHTTLPTIDFALPLLPGDVLNTLAVRITGKVDVTAPGHGVMPAALPKIQLLSIDTNGVVTTIAQDTDSTASTPAYDVPHTVTLSSSDDPDLPLTVPDDSILVVRIVGETSAAVSTTAILAITGTAFARHARNSKEIY